VGPWAVPLRLLGDPIMAPVRTTTGSLPLSEQSVKRFPIYPLGGILATAIGTVSAVALIPNDFYPEGALLPSAAAMICGLLVAPVYASITNPKNFLRVEHILVLSPVYWLLMELLQGGYSMEGTSRQGVEWAFWMTGLFVCGVWIAVLTRPWRLPSAVNKAASHVLERQTLFKLILLFFSLGMFSFAYPSGFDPGRMLDGLMSNRWAAPWSRDQFGGWDAFLDHMAYFGYLIPTLTVLLARRVKVFDPRLLISALFSIITVAFLAQGGGRRIIGVVVGAAILCWAIEQANISVRKVIIIALSASALLITMEFMLEYRDTGVTKIAQAGENQVEYGYLHVDDNFLRLSQIIDLVPRDYPYVYHKQIVYTLVRPIPRALWPGKPTDPGFDLPGALGEKGVSLSSSVIGELYFSGGWLVVLLGGVLYGKLAGMLSRLFLGHRGTSGVLVYSLGTMAIVAGMRSMVELVLMSYTLLAWIAVSRLFLKRRSPRSEARSTPNTQPAMVKSAYDHKS
jgi:oligosaccharide repeat unit polymerase